MSVKVEVGQWYKNERGYIRKCVYIIEHPNYRAKFLMEWDDGSAGFVQDHEVGEHLPDCTGFDWEPPKPIVAPEGWEIVEEGFCKKGDRYLFCSGQTGTINIRVGEDVQDAKDARGAVAIIRKIEPKYRPFANAEEFKPHRDRWIRRREGDGACRTSSYCDQGHFTDGVFDTWQEMFERSVFEDGTPFGVLDD